MDYCRDRLDNYNLCCRCGDMGITTHFREKIVEEITCEATVKGKECGRRAWWAAVWQTKDGWKAKYLCAWHRRAYLSVPHARFHVVPLLPPWCPGNCLVCRRKCNEYIGSHNLYT